MTKLTEMQTTVLLAFPGGADAEGDNGASWTDVADLATETGLTKKQVQAVLGSLSTKGLIYADEEGGNGNIIQCLTDDGARLVGQIMEERYGEPKTDAENAVEFIEAQTEELTPEQQAIDDAFTNLDQEKVEELMEAPAEEEVPATEIKVTYSAVDGARTVRKFKTLAGAQAFAHKAVGEHPDLGSGYAVSFDGIGKIEVEGCALSALFPEPKAPAELTWETCKTPEDVFAVAKTLSFTLESQDAAAIVAGFPGVHKNLKSLGTFHWKRFPKATPRTGTFIVLTKKNGAVIIEGGEVLGPLADKATAIVALWKC